MARAAIEDRLWAKVIKTDTCWLWDGATTANGYGVIGKPGRGAGNVLVHRLSYELARGPIPKGLHIDHTCSQRLCVNPDHLEAVTQAENNRRSRERTTWASVDTCKRGHPFDEANTYRSARQRHCRTCAKERAAERWARLNGEETEAQFQARVVQLARLCQFKVYHTYDSRRSEPGFPDLVLVHPGRRLVLFRELKREKGSLTPAQRAWISDLVAAGADACAWRPSDWPLIEQTLKGPA